MGRTRHVAWVYTCDAASWGPSGTYSCDAVFELSRGDYWPTDLGTVVIRTQADADAVARQGGWTLGNAVLCPDHAHGGAS